jgi:threonine/homoserine/homoserine lactone efflux protein
LTVFGQAVGNLLPSAVGVALSPIPIIAVILMLDTPKSRSNGLAFALGWVAGLLVVSVIVLAAASGASHPDSDASTSVNTIKLVLGLAFLVMAAGQWRKRPKKGEAPGLPKWMATIDDFDPPRSAVFGAILSGANPKNLALTIAAAGSIAQAGLGGGQTVGAVAIFILVGSLTVAGPVVFYLANPKKAGGTLGAIKEFMSDHNAVIMFVVLLVLGAKLIGDAIGGLSS